MIGISMDAARKTILIIDDEPDTLVYFTCLLEDHGFNVITAEDAAEGLKKALSHLPDLITLDLSMPEKSGILFYREIKENAASKDIPVIIISGVSEDLQPFLSSADRIPLPEAFLSKPIIPDELLETISRLIR
ncbi:MAG: response regulator [bacterium]